MPIDVVDIKLVVFDEPVAIFCFVVVVDNGFRGEVEVVVFAEGVFVWIDDELDIRFGFVVLIDDFVVVLLDISLRVVEDGTDDDEDVLLDISLRVVEDGTNDDEDVLAILVPIDEFGRLVLVVNHGRQCCIMTRLRNSK